MLIPKRPFSISNRNGAALIIALVLLLFVSVLSAVILRQLYNGRLETQRQLLYAETDLLIRDMQERAEQRRAATPSFTGESVTLKELSPHLDGTFQLTTHVDKEITVDAAYRDKNDAMVYTATK
ncbi:MAG: hypothetical protein LBJ67_00505 [Planctomycetaceae bacterium]|nr:hypothetical protein [Planctomycetaceae bacterium]